MYTFRQKTEISRRIAKADNIDLYRKMLKPHRASAAGRVMQNRQALAESLVYNLLDFYTEEQLSATPAVLVTSQMRRPKSEDATAPAVKKKVSKFEEYPDIRWKDLDDPLVRTADSIFTDRINCWSRLAEIERETAGAAELPVETLSEIVFTSIRGELCFSELRNFNKTGRFLGKHPFIAQADERSRVMEILHSDPDRYFDERKNIELNISRYSSQINSKKTTKEQKERARENMERYQARLQMYKDIFKECIQK